MIQTREQDRYEIGKRNDQIVYVTDKKANSEANEKSNEEAGEHHFVIPSCGQDAIDCYEYLRSSLRHGNREAQNFLERIVAGDKPVTELCDEIMSHRANYQKSTNSPRLPR